MSIGSWRWSSRIAVQRENPARRRADRTSARPPTRFPHAGGARADSLGARLAGHGERPGDGFTLSPVAAAEVMAVAMIASLADSSPRAQPSRSSRRPARDARWRSARSSSDVTPCQEYSNSASQSRVPQCDPCISSASARERHQRAQISAVDQRGDRSLIKSVDGAPTPPSARPSSRGSCSRPSPAPPRP